MSGSGFAKNVIKFKWNKILYNVNNTVQLNIHCTGGYVYRLLTEVY